MRFWILKQVARLMGLEVQMTAYKHITPPSIAAGAMPYAEWFKYFVAREGLYGRRDVVCVVLATDALAAVEMMHHVNVGVDLGQTECSETVQ